MNTSRWRPAAVIAALAILLGFAVIASGIVPLVESTLYTPRIPTAPPLAPAPAATGVPTMAAMPRATPADVPAETSAPGAAIAATPTSLPAEREATDTPSQVPVATPAATATIWPGTAPVSVRMPSINLVAPVTEIGLTYEEVNGGEQAIWDVPDYRAVGWHQTSAPLGVAGNTVLNGHNTSKGEVFRDLYKAEIGAQIFVEGADGETYVYRVGGKYILAEAGQPLEVRLENARYIQTTAGERLTLVTCHPYGSLANRLVLLAYPDEGAQLGNGVN